MHLFPLRVLPLKSIDRHVLKNNATQIVNGQPKFSNSLPSKHYRTIIRRLNKVFSGVLSLFYFNNTSKYQLFSIYHPKLVFRLGLWFHQKLEATVKPTNCRFYFSIAIAFNHRRRLGAEFGGTEKF